MEQYEERLQILFNQLIDNETLDKSIWNRLFLITIQYDVLYHTDICSIFRTGTLVLMCLKNGKNFPHFLLSASGCLLKNDTFCN